MDHILQVRAEHQSGPKLCDRGGVARFTRSAGDASLVTLALAAIGFLALFFLSPCFSSVAGSPSSSSPSTLSARLVAVVGGGSIFTSKTAPFLLSNVIFVLLVADYYRCCLRLDDTASAGHAAASSGEPAAGVLEKQAQHHQVKMQVQVEQRAVKSCAPCSASLDHDEQEGEDRSTTMYAAKTLPDEGQLSELELELVRLGEEQDSSIALELETVDVEEPTCEAAQGLERLEISELNKKFDEFIRSRRIKWVKEEACLLLYEV